MKELTKFLTFFICLSSTFSCTNNDDTMEKESIYQTIETLDNWYTNGLIKKDFNQPKHRLFIVRTLNHFLFQGPMKVLEST